MLSVKAVYKEGKFIPESRSFPEGDNKHVIIVFPDEEANLVSNQSRTEFIKKWRGVLKDSKIDLSKIKEERLEAVRRKHL